MDILLGKDDISFNEAQAIREAMHTETGRPSYEYAFSHELDCDNSCDDGDDLLKEARRDARKLKYKHPAIPLIKKLLKEDNPPHAALMMLDSYDDYQKSEYARGTQITPRTLPLSVWNDHEDSPEVALGEEMIDELEEEALNELFNELCPDKQRKVLETGLKAVGA